MNEVKELNRPIGGYFFPWMMEDTKSLGTIYDRIRGFGFTALLVKPHEFKIEMRAHKDDDDLRAELARINNLKDLLEFGFILEELETGPVQMVDLMSQGFRDQLSKGVLDIYYPKDGTQKYYEGAYNANTVDCFLDNEVIVVRRVGAFKMRLRDIPLYKIMLSANLYGHYDNWKKLVSTAIKELKESDVSARDFFDVVNYAKMLCYIDKNKVFK